MRKKTLASITLAVTFALSLPALAAESTAPRKTLKAFASEAELAELFKGWAAEYRRRDEARRAQSLGGIAQMQSAPAPASAPAMAAKESLAAGASADSVTNVQHAGVDEGGIVKLHGDHLVILRRGRLFTVRVGERDRGQVGLHQRLPLAGALQLRMVAVVARDLAPQRRDVDRKSVV